MAPTNLAAHRPGLLAIDRIKAIHERLPNTHLVMHGSSTVPQDLLKEINEYGGEIAGTYGVPVQEIQRGIKRGVRKVNIDTDLRLASTASIRRFLTEILRSLIRASIWRYPRKP